jgi:nucleotide-binding universal stress UspA family protein
MMYKKIMVPLDGSELAECVLPHVEAFISHCRIQTIVFVWVLETITPAVAGEYAINIEELEKQEASRRTTAEEYLKKIVGRFHPEDTKLLIEVLSGRPADKLADYAEKNGVDLILMATHGRSGVSRWVRGSVADRILRAASAPVLMVRAPGVTGKQD